MGVFEDQALRALADLWPEFQIWYVPIYTPPSTTWCALAHAEANELPMRTINAPDPELLVEKMTDRRSELAARGVTLRNTSSSRE